MNSRNQNTVYIAVTQLFDELENSLAEKNIRKVYYIYRNCLTQAIEQKLQGVTLQFAGGLSSKVDYLLKEYNADSSLRYNIQDTRNRLRHLYSAKDDALKKSRFLDLRNICLFVAHIYNAVIPDILQQTFPQTTSSTPKHTVISDCLRVIVESWDSDKIVATPEEGEDKISILFRSHLGDKEIDRSYLRSMLYKGERLNLIRPRQKDGYYVPELIVVLPDYLVDVSSIANCFETYADSADVHLVKKLKPSANTQATILGNFASQLLDETINSLNEKSYKQSISDFFRKNAIAMATCSDLNATFHQNAQKQNQHIKSAIKDLTRFDKTFDTNNTILEPSFYCEILGLQGRMDMLQLDYNLLIEQKSGKSEWPEPQHPGEAARHKEQHYVQLLLYMAILHYAFNKKNDDIYAFLLYSKYDAGLIKEGPAPDLLFSAIKIRNQIAFENYQFAQNDFLQNKLEYLSANTLNQKSVADKLWVNYTEPELNALFAPIHSASELERAYYFRFLKFIQTEQLHSKIGQNERNNAGQASIWNVSCEEKKQSGNIYDNLQLRQPVKTDDGVSLLVLDYEEDDSNDMANFRKGDIVILYSYRKGQEPDACSTMVFRATILDIQATSITLRLRFAQSDPHVFERDRDYAWAIEHDYMESSFGSLYRGMHAFLSAPKERRILLLLQREPNIDTSIHLSGKYGQFNDLVLHAKQAKDFFLVIGPPGTGKTSFGLVNILREELKQENSSVLLMSYTNRAVDEICSKLEEHEIEYIRVGNFANCPDIYRNRLLESRAAEIFKIDEIKNLIRQNRVFVGTTTAINANKNLFSIKQFDLAIIDEASQILEPQLIGLLSEHYQEMFAIKKFILIGDHKQLPAVVQQSKQESAISETDILQSIGLKNCANSLFERLLSKYKNQKEVVYMLTKQGRMHPEISAFPNYEFYQNKLEPVPLEHQKKLYPNVLPQKHENAINDLLATRPISFIAVTSDKNAISDKVNQREADVIAAIVVSVYNLRRTVFSVDDTIGVIVPYRNQIAAIRKTIDKYGIKDLQDITIDTVERYQGSQRDVIIYGFTISKFYQLNFLTSNIVEEDGALIDRKLNVALTRAKENLIIVGDPTLLSENFTFYKLIEFIKTKQGYFDVPIKDFCEGHFDVPVRTSEMDFAELQDSINGLSMRFATSFNNLVTQRIKSDKRTIWPDYILGNEWNTNRSMIGYGRIDFSTPILQVSDNDKQHGCLLPTTYSAEDQVVIYAHIMMRMHYCSASAIYNSHAGYLTLLAKNYANRMWMIDFGCGPATCGIALADAFDAQHIEIPSYIGIDVSLAMRNMGKQFYDNTHAYDNKYMFIKSLLDLSDDFWEKQSELPSAFVFNFSYFFSNVDAIFTEELANRLVTIMRKYTLNKYVFIIQQSECDNALSSYVTFMRLMHSHIHVLTSESASFTYYSGGIAKTIPFYYTIMESD